MAVKHILLGFSEVEHKRMLKIKGKATWIDILKLGIEKKKLG